MSHDGPSKNKVFVIIGLCAVVLGVIVEVIWRAKSPANAAYKSAGPGFLFITPGLIVFTMGLLIEN